MSNANFDLSTYPELPEGWVWVIRYNEPAANCDAKRCSIFLTGWISENERWYGDSPIENVICVSLEHSPAYSSKTVWEKLPTKDYRDAANVLAMRLMLGEI